MAFQRKYCKSITVHCDYRFTLSFFLGPSTFSLKEDWGIYFWVYICTTAFFTSFRKKTTSPVLEILVDIFLLLGIGINSWLFYTLKYSIVGVIGNLPIMLIFMITLMKNHKKVIAFFEKEEITPQNKLNELAWQVLSLHPILKYPMLLVISIPIVVILSLVLWLLGQHPDMLIAEMQNL